MKYIFAVIMFSVACQEVDNFAEFRDGLVHIVDAERHEEKTKGWHDDELDLVFMQCGESLVEYWKQEDIGATDLAVGQTEICHIEVYDIGYMCTAMCDRPVKKCSHNRIDCDGVYVWTFGDC